MRAGVVGVLVGACVALAWSCTTSRVSDNFTCTTNADCDPDRVCDTGYCVIGSRPVDARVYLDAPVCPAICAGTCDFTKQTCTITGTGTPISCPTGWNCSIECSTSGACPSISCTNAASCDVSCTTAAACGNISCTTSDCSATCSGGQNACGNLTCTTGDCTRTCIGQAACGTMSCTSGDCTQTCSGGQQACNNLTCGTGKCTATCQGVNSACKDVTCNTSCGCAVNCDDVTNTCPSNMACRTFGNKYCSDTGLMGDVCTLMGSGSVQGCNQCP